jgi:hypothetical protein
MDLTIHDPVYEHFAIQMGQQQLDLHRNADLYRTWARHFSPVGGTKDQVSIPLSWASFFAAALLNHYTTKWAREFLTSEAWKIMASFMEDQDTLAFVLPKGSISGSKCTLSEMEGSAATELSTPDKSSAETLKSWTTSVLHPKKRKYRQVTLVDTEDRRSLRLKSKNTSIKPDTKQEKTCQDCTRIASPTISQRVIQNFGREVLLLAGLLLLLAGLSEVSKDTKKKKDNKKQDKNGSKKTDKK